MSGEDFFRLIGTNQFDMNRLKTRQKVDLGTVQNDKLQAYLRQQFDADNSGSIEVENSEGQNEIDKLKNWLLGLLKSVTGSNNTEFDDNKTEAFLAENINQSSDSNKVSLSDFKSIIINLFKNDETKETSNTKKEQYTDENGEVIEKEITYGENGKPIKIKQTVGNKTISKTFDYSFDIVKIIEKDSDGNETLTTVENVSEDGSYNANDFISKTTNTADGKKIEVQKIQDGKIIENIKSDGTVLTTLYNTDSIYSYENNKDLPQYKMAQIYVDKDGKEYAVEYNDGHTITHARAGDGVNRLVKNLGFKDKEEFFELNPEIKKVADKRGIDNAIDFKHNIVTPTILDANSSEIIGQGDLGIERQKSDKAESNLQFKNFIEKHLPRLKEHEIKELSSIPGFELNDDNISMYLELNRVLEGADAMERRRFISEITSEIKKRANAGRTPGKENPFWQQSTNDIKDYFLNNEVDIKKGNEIQHVKLNFYGESSINFDKWSSSTSVSATNFIKDVLKLDPSSGEGKLLYERLNKIKDQKTYTDLESAFSGIRQRQNSSDNSALIDQLKEMYNYYSGNGINTNTTLAKATEAAIKRNSKITDEQAIEMYKAVIISMTTQQGEKVPEAYKDIVNKHSDYINAHKGAAMRAMSYSFINNSYQMSVDLLEEASDNKDMLNPSKYLNKGLAGLYRKMTPKLMERFNKAMYADPELFNELQQFITAGLKEDGVEFNENKIQRFIDKLDDPNSSDQQKMNAAKDAFGDQITMIFGKNEKSGVVNDVIELGDFLDGVVDTYLMIQGTNVIGKGVNKVMGASTKGIKAVIKTDEGMAKFNNIKNIASTVATFTTYDAARYTIGYYTNDIDEDYSYAEGLQSTLKHTVPFAIFAGTWGSLVTSNVLKRMSGGMKGADAAYKAMGEVRTAFKTKAAFSSSELLAKYAKAEAAASTTIGKEMVGFGLELAGFSAYEYINTGISTGNWNDLDQVFGNQTQTLLMFKVVGGVARMHQAGKTENNGFKANKDLQIENVGDRYRVVHPDGKECYLNSIDEAVAYSNAYYENITIYEPIENALKNNKTVDIGNGDIITKEGDKYVITLGDKKIEGKDLKKVVLDAQNQYSYQQIENKARKNGVYKFNKEQTIEYNSERNSFTTKSENGTVVESDSVENLIQKLTEVNLSEAVNKQIDSYGAALLNDVRITTTEDGLYRGEIVLSDGHKEVIEAKSLNEVMSEAEFIRSVDSALRKSSESTKHNTQNPERIKTSTPTILPSINPNMHNEAMKNMPMEDFLAEVGKVIKEEAANRSFFPDPDYNPSDEISRARENREAVELILNDESIEDKSIAINRLNDANKPYALDILKSDLRGSVKIEILRCIDESNGAAIVDFVKSGRANIFTEHTMYDSFNDPIVYDNNNYIDYVDNKNIKYINELVDYISKKAPKEFVEELCTNYIETFCTGDENLFGSHDNQQARLEVMKERIDASIEKTSKERESIQNPELKELFYSSYERSRLIDLDLSLRMVKDERIAKEIITLAKEGKLEDAEALIDSMNNIDGNANTLYSTYYYMEKTRTFDFASYLKEKGMDVEDLDPFDSFSSVKNNAKTIMKDFQNDLKYRRMQDFISKNPTSETSNYLYNEYYLNDMASQGVEPEIISKCKQINEQFNIKVILSSNTSEMKEVLSELEKEMTKWQQASGRQAKLPPVLDFSTANREWYDSTFAYGQSASAAYSQPRYNGSQAYSTPTVENLLYVMRHETTHTNDLKQGDVDSSYDKLFQTANNENAAENDVKSREFYNEFVKIGIPEWHIPYAYNNSEEFIAVASEGDLTKASPEFIEVLIDMGMPEWQLNIYKSEAESRGETESPADANKVVTNETTEKPSLWGRVKSQFNRFFGNETTHMPAPMYAQRGADHSENGQISLDRKSSQTAILSQSAMPIEANPAQETAKKDPFSLFEEISAAKPELAEKMEQLKAKMEKILAEKDKTKDTIERENDEIQTELLNMDGIIEFGEKAFDLVNEFCNRNMKNLKVEVDNVVKTAETETEANVENEIKTKPETETQAKAENSTAEDRIKQAKKIIDQYRSQYADNPKLIEELDKIEKLMQEYLTPDKISERQGNADASDIFDKVTKLKQFGLDETPELSGNLTKLIHQLEVKDLSLIDIFRQQYGNMEFTDSKGNRQTVNDVLDAFETRILEYIEADSKDTQNQLANDLPIAELYNVEGINGDDVFALNQAFQKDIFSTIDNNCHLSGNEFVTDGTIGAYIEKTLDNGKFPNKYLRLAFEKVLNSYKGPNKSEYVERYQQSLNDNAEPGVTPESIANGNPIVEMLISQGRDFSISESKLCKWATEAMQELQMPENKDRDIDDFIVDFLGRHL